MTLDEINTGEMFAFIDKDSYRVYIKTALPKKMGKHAVIILLGKGAGDLVFRAGDREIERVSPLALDRWMFQ